MWQPWVGDEARRSETTGSKNERSEVMVNDRSSNNGLRVSDSRWPQSRSGSAWRDCCSVLVLLAIDGLRCVEQCKIPGRVV
jgi:hypothetical protein